jgi:hypothetical protein
LEVHDMTETKTQATPEVAATPDLKAAMHKVLDTPPAAPAPATDRVHVDFFLNGKAVGPSMNRLERVATFYAHHVREKVTIEGIDKTGPVWLKVNEFKILLRHMGVEVPITKDFDLTLPNGKQLSARVAGSKSPVPQPVKAEKAAKAAKAPAQKAAPAPVSPEARKATLQADKAAATDRAAKALSAITGDAQAHVTSLSRVRKANEATKAATQRATQREVNSAAHAAADKEAHPSGGKQAPTTMARR